MNKGIAGAGFGLLLLLGGLYVASSMAKEDASQAVPAMEAGYKAANTANALTLNMARTMYLNANGKAPEKIGDLVPSFVSGVPAEAFSKSAAVTASYDGSGGWVMDAEGFRPNHPQELPR